MKKYLLVALALTLLVGCGANTTNNGDDPPKPPVGPKSSIMLKSFESCGEMKDHIVADMERMVEEVNQNRCRYEYSGSPDDGYIADSPSPSAEQTGGDAGVNYTDTNVQEAGVDEADLVKTDGEYLYVATAEGVDIFKIWPFADFAKIASIDINGDPDSLYLFDRYLLVLSKGTRENVDAVKEASSDSYYPASNTVKTVIMSFINISTPTTPELVRESVYDGSLIDSRAVDNMAHVAIRTQLNSMPALNYYVPYSELPLCEGAADTETAINEPLVGAVETLRQDNLAVLQNWDLSSSLINVRHKRFSGFTGAEIDESSTVGCTDIMRSDSVLGQTFTAIISVNVNNLNAEDKTETIIGDASNVYASEDSMYIASYRNRWFYDLDSSENSEQTVIHRFLLGDSRTETSYYASTSVPGHLLNQFSMSEYRRYLRVATTIGNVIRGTSSSSNNVYTIDIEDPEMPISGKIEDLALGEKIYAVRFVGPRGFVVTFKKVDPLFAIDLSDPLNPEVKGELKVPGYSTYLHSFDEDNLIGLGFDADDMGSFAWFQGIQLSIFDVSDMENPTRTHNIVIGTRGTNSDAVMDHHAFTFDRSRNLLSIPIDVAEGGTGGNDYGDCTYAGMQVYKVTLENGFDLVGEIKRTDLGCKSDWWTSTSQAKRSIILGDGNNEGIIVVWGDRVDLYNLSNVSLVGSENVNLPDDNYYW